MDFPSVSHGHPLSQIPINPKLQGKEVALLKQRNQWQKPRILKREKYAIGNSCFCAHDVGVLGSHYQALGSYKGSSTEVDSYMLFHPS